MAVALHHRKSIHEFATDNLARSSHWTRSNLRIPLPPQLSLDHPLAERGRAPTRPLPSPARQGRREAYGIYMGRFKASSWRLQVLDLLPHVQRPPLCQWLQELLPIRRQDSWLRPHHHTRPHMSSIPSCWCRDHVRLLLFWKVQRAYMAHYCL